MDAEISKATQKILAKQGMKFKLNTKLPESAHKGLALLNSDDDHSKNAALLYI